MLTPNLLHDYQKKAVNFQCSQPNTMLWLDMGLGKTAQAIAALSLMKAERGPAPSLVVAPTSLLDNWRAEAAKFNPSTTVKTRVGGGMRFTVATAGGPVR